MNLYDYAVATVFGFVIVLALIVGLIKLADAF